MNVPQWDRKPFIQRHYFEKSLHLKKGENKIRLRLSELSDAQRAAAKRGITEKATLFTHRDKDGLCLWTIELFRPEAYEAIQKRAGEMKSNLDWMIEGKYGIFVHFTPISYASSGSTLLKDQYQKMVDMFDVDVFASTIAQTGASWVCLTTSHGAHYWPGPSKAIDEVMSGRTCERNLIGDLIAALKKHDIRLMLYYHFGWGLEHDSEWAIEVGMTEKNPSRWFDFVESHFREVSLRYGKELVSTGGYVDDSGFIAYQ